MGIHQSYVQMQINLWFSVLTWKKKKPTTKRKQKNNNNNLKNLNDNQLYKLETTTV